MIKIRCKNCKKIFQASPSRKSKKFFCSMKCYLPFRTKIIIKFGKKTRWSKKRLYIGWKKVVSGKNHHLWKGGKVGYRGLHYWLQRQLGRAKKCIKCGKTEGRIQWANKDGKYRRNIKDFLPMCPSCHKTYDNKLRKKLCQK